LVIVAVPSHAYRGCLLAARDLLPPECPLVWATKGLEHGSGRFLHEVTEEILGSNNPQAIISGPSFAREVAAGLPTAITVASADGDFATRLARQLHGDGLRAYSSTDVIGVEVGGAVKNVLAIAAGISDGLGYGANSRSALITRGLAEVVRLGVAVGGLQETFMGLAGLGDLVLTCTDDQSRNRRFGLAIGSGAALDKARDDIGQVVEGAATAREIMRLAGSLEVDMPICEQVDRVVHHGLAPRRAVDALLAREPRAESG
jgi:glycerol-3-phosphate dehydrogenase (NAD(P)+)